MRSHSKYMYKWQLTSLLRFTSKRAIPGKPAWIDCITRWLIVMVTSSHHWNGVEVSRKHGSICLARPVTLQVGPPTTTGPPGPSTAVFVAIDGPPGQVWQTMTATDGPALPQVAPLALFNATCNK